MTTKIVAGIRANGYQTPPGTPKNISSIVNLGQRLQGMSLSPHHSPAKRKSIEEGKVSISMSDDALESPRKKTNAAVSRTLPSPNRSPVASHSHSHNFANGTGPGGMTHYSHNFANGMGSGSAVHHSPAALMSNSRGPLHHNSPQHMQTSQLSLASASNGQPHATEPVFTFGRVQIEPMDEDSPVGSPATPPRIVRNGGIEMLAVQTPPDSPEDLELSPVRSTSQVPPNAPQRANGQTAHGMGLIMPRRLFE